MAKQQQEEKPKSVAVHVEKNEKDDLEAPKDRFQMIFILFFILGLVHLLPWSFFTCANKYWMYKFRNTTSNETDSEFRTTLQADFSASIMITLQISEVAFLIIGLLFGRLLTVKVRFIGILTIIFGLFVVLAIFVKVDTDSWQEMFFAMVMAITAGINSVNAVFTITLYTTVSNFPQRYLASYLTGTSLSRIFTSILQLLSLATGLSVTDSALVYFSLGLFVIGISLILVIIATTKNKFYLYQMRNYQGQPETRVTFQEGKQLFKKIWSSIALFGVFTITNNMCQLNLVVSEGEGNGPWNDTYFVPTITFFLASVADLVGRGISFKFAPKLSHTGWTFLGICRSVYMIPLIMLCNAQPRHHLPVVFPHDYQYIIILTVYSISGTYLVSRASYNIAGYVEKEELKNAYHVQMLFVGLQMGIFSFLSIISVDLL